MKSKSNLHTIGIVSLGCSKNLVDTEVLMRQLDANRFKLIIDPTEQDQIQTAIINTCGFILDAKNESIDIILKFVRAKQEGRIRRLFVMGCLTERYKSELKAGIPEVDAYFGVNELPKIIQRVGGEFRSELLGERLLTTPSHYAYLKIAEGCDRRCSFCSIPLIRGKHQSKPIEELTGQAEWLARQGVKELILISQDTTWYGLDLYGRRELGSLLRSIAQVSGIEWIRLHYSYPEQFPLEVLDIINDHQNICKYIDIPFQHINPRILRSMRRGIGREKTIKLIRKIRDKVPGITLRTTFITGYPGETEKEFSELMEFVKEFRFERAGVFTYSHEEETAAFRLNDNVPQKVKYERADELMALQEEISLNINRSKLGQELKIVIDRREDQYYVGRTEADSPEIDHEVLVPADKKKLTIGQFYRMQITEAESFDLFGSVIT